MGPRVTGGLRKASLDKEHRTRYFISKKKKKMSLGSTDTLTVLRSVSSDTCVEKANTSLHNILHSETGDLIQEEDRYLNLLSETNQLHGSFHLAKLHIVWKPVSDSQLRTGESPSHHSAVLIDSSLLTSDSFYSVLPSQSSEDPVL